MFSMRRPMPFSAGDLADFTHGMATLLQHGVSMEETLRIMQQTMNAPQAEVIRMLHEDVTGGLKFREALLQKQQYFDPFFVNLFKSSELSMAEPALVQDATTCTAIIGDSVNRVKQAIRQRLFYIVAVIMVLVVTAGIMFIFVLPQFQELFNNMGTDLPLFTHMVIKLSEFFTVYGWLILGILLITGLLGGWFYRNSGAFRRTVITLIAGTPGAGNFFTLLDKLRFIGTASIFLANDKPVHMALNAASDSVRDIRLQHKMQSLGEAVSRGGSLYDVVVEKNLFDRSFRRAVRIGERVNLLEDEFERQVLRIKPELEKAGQQFVDWMISLTFTLMAVLVGSFVIAMYLPIFKLGSTV